MYHEKLVTRATWLQCSIDRIPYLHPDSFDFIPCAPNPSIYVDDSSSFSAHHSFHSIDEIVFLYRRHFNGMSISRLFLYWSDWRRAWSDYHRNGFDSCSVDNRNATCLYPTIIITLCVAYEILTWTTEKQVLMIVFVILAVAFPTYTLCSISLLRGGFFSSRHIDGYPDVPVSTESSIGNVDMSSIEMWFFLCWPRVFVIHFHIHVLPWFDDRLHFPSQSLFPQLVFFLSNMCPESFLINPFLRKNGFSYDLL